jgi:Domain of unknown function (DUF4190)
VSQSDTPGAPDPWASVPGASIPPPYPGVPGAPGPGYGPYPPPGAMPPYYQPGYQQQRRTNGLSVASMVCGICGFVYLVPAVLGIIFGIIALRQINRDRNDGKGMAIAGIITGSLWLIGFVVLIVAIITVGVDSER